MGIIWLVLGITICIWSSTFPFGGLAKPGAGYLPFGLGVFVSVFGVLLLFQSKRRGESKSLENSQSPFPQRSGVKRIIFCLANMLFAAAFLEYLGFSLTIFFMILFLMQTVEPQPWRKALFYSFIFALGALLVFKVLLHTELPGGIFGI